MSSPDEGLAQLRNLSTKDRKQCIETLITILRNVTTNPDEAKFRTLKLSNKRFAHEVWRHEAAQGLLLASGWLLLEDVIYLPDEADVSGAMAALIRNRDVKPAESEWVSETKIVGQNVKQLKEEALRAKALQQKAKEMAELKKDMVERKAIAARIMNEHRMDQQEKRVTKPSVSRPRGDGGSTSMRDMIAQGAEDGGG